MTSRGADRSALDAAQVVEMGREMRSLLGLSGSPVGVALIRSGEPRPDGALELRRHRYCQAVMKARKGQDVVLDGMGIACPAAAAAFGFRALPAGLQSGGGLVGFGIVSQPATGGRMFHDMPRLPIGSIEALHLFPLEEAHRPPDVVVVEDEVERLMWIALASLHISGGERVNASTAVLQAMCVDSTIIPYLEGRLNLGFGCYGCREATDIEPGEAALGFPVSALGPIVEHLEFLSQKAIPNSRSKRALHSLGAGESGAGGDGQAVEP